MIEIELLGAPRVLRDGAEVRLSVKKTIALLAYLALEQRVTRAKLATLLWGELDDDSARRNLRRELHRLREARLGEALQAEDNHIALSTDVACDVLRFLATSEQDPPVALASYHGPLLDGFDLADAQDFNDWLAAKRDELARRWSETAAAEAARYEARGDAHSALKLHTQLLAHDPLQESHYANAMRLSYLLGERARALEWYERLRAVLRDELGLEPLPETAAFAEQVRAAEQLAPLVARKGTAGIARFETPLVGREAELDELTRADRSVVLIVGEAGIGKTRLAQALTTSFPHCISMRFGELERAAPLQAVTQTLKNALNEPALRAKVDVLDAATRLEIARLIPELEESPSAAREAPTGTTRTRFFGALETMLLALSSGGALWIDDLHWADDASLELIELVAHALSRERKANGNRAILVITARSHELAEHAAAAALTLKLERSSIMHRLQLTPLSESATLQLVRALSGSHSGNLFAQRLQRATLGNPFFLLETIRFLFDSGDLAVDDQGNWVTRYDDATSDYAELPVPPTVQQAILERVQRLGPATSRVLHAAAIAGYDFTLDEVQPATALSDWEALEGIERAVNVNLVERAGLQYRFIHDLARMAISLSLGEERRRLINFRIAEALIGLQGRADRIARHLDDAGRPAQARPWHLAAAADAEKIFAHSDALAHYAQALAATTEPPAQVSMLRARVRLLFALHDLPAVEAELDRLTALAHQLSDAVLTAECLVQQAQLAVRAHQYARAVDLASRAKAHAGYPRLSPLLREQAAVVLAFALVEEGQYQQAQVIYERELADTAPDNPRHLGHLHHGMANLLTSLDADAQARVHLEKAVELLAAAGDVEQQMRSLNILAYTQHTTGDTAAAIDTMQRALNVAESMHSVTLLRNTLLNFVVYCLHAGDFKRAEMLTARAAEALRFTHDAATEARLQIRVAEVACAKGELEQAITAASGAVQLIERNGGGLPDFWPWFVLAGLLWRCGDHAAAVDVYAKLPLSSAWLDTAAPAVKFFSCVYRLPHNADEVVRVLPNLALGPGVMCRQDLIDFFRAYALHVLGRNQEALEILEPNGSALKPHPFAMHGASVTALRIEVRAALKLADESLLLEAADQLRVAPPFESIELCAALSKSATLNSDEAAQYVDRAQATIDRLAHSLADPRRAKSLRMFWSARLARL